MRSQTETASLTPAPQLPMLRNRSFVALMAAQAVSNLGDYMHGLALIWLMGLLTDGSAFWMSMIAVAQIVPRIVIGPFSGVLVDRWNKLFTMRAVDLTAGLLVAAIAIFSYLGQITPLLLLLITFLLATSTTFFNPSKQVLLTYLVAKEDLLKANSISQTINTVCMLGGPILAGLLIALVGPYLVFGLNAGTFLLSLGCLTLIRATGKKAETKDQADANFWQEFREGFQVINNIAIVKALMPIALFINFLFAPMGVFLAKFVTDVYHGGARELGYLESGFGLGMLLGAVTVGLANKYLSKYTIFMGGLFGSAVGVFVLSLSHQLWLGIVGGIIMEACLIWSNTMLGTVMQQVVPQEKMGRVFALMQTLMGGSQPLANVTFGMVLNLIVINHLLLIVSLLFFAANITALFRKPLRQIQ